ncbi:MAG: type II toxin-antitoxin system VapC family toxin [Acidobacteriota bacterium]
MIGVDTNVLVRWLTADDPEQLEKVDRFVEKAVERKEPLHVDSIMLCELVWVLRRAYRFSREEVADAVAGLLSTRQFEIDGRDRVRRALADFRQGPGDFSDYLIAARNQHAGCSSTVTFDRALRSHGSIRLL